MIAGPDELHLEIVSRLSAFELPIDADRKRRHRICHLLLIQANFRLKKQTSFSSFSSFEFVQHLLYYQFGFFDFGAISDNDSV